jgi:hypothetical protein
MLWKKFECDVLSFLVENLIVSIQFGSFMCNVLFFFLEILFIQWNFEMAMNRMECWSPCDAAKDEMT